MYGYTLQIPAGCMINGQRYRTLNKPSQRSKLIELMENFVIGNFTAYFEEHKDGRLHCHGLIQSTDKQALELSRQMINHNLNYRRDAKFTLKFDYLPSERDLANFLYYCLKNQQELFETPPVESRHSPGTTAGERGSAKASPPQSFLMTVELKDNEDTE